MASNRSVMPLDTVERRSYIDLCSVVSRTGIRAGLRPAP